MNTQGWPLRLRCLLCLGVLALVAYVASCPVVRADIPEFIGDGELVDRFELIVIGGLREDSVRPVRHPGGFRGEHATLVIKEVLKGKFKGQQIPLLIRHGLQVTIKEGKVELRSNSTSPMQWLPVAADARQDQIWFLRKRQGGDGRPDAPWMWSVYGSHEVQNVDLAEYFKLLLSPEPESKVRDYLKSRPQLAVRAVEYLESREVRRILKEPNPAIRYQKLWPYCLGAAHEATRSSARRALFEGGPESGPYLMAAFQRYQHDRHRPDIIQIWARTGYTGCADLLVALLDENHRAYLRLHGRLEREGSESRINPQDVTQLASEVRAAIYALAEIGDPRAEQLIAETSRRWREIPSAQEEILNACYSAMESIEQRRRKALQTER
ncbi:MAG: hypothetical protein WD894_06285 [Pirellulales bacterium]